jgi:hypothetical protein
MFEALLGKIVGSTPMSERAESVAFLKVARDLYQLKGLAYLGVNIPVASGQLRFAHCSYTDTSVRQCVSTNGTDRREKKAQIMPEIRILSDYLHSHVLRINGQNSTA